MIYIVAILYKMIDPYVILVMPFYFYFKLWSYMLSKYPVFNMAMSYNLVYTCTYISFIFMTNKSVMIFSVNKISVCMCLSVSNVSESRLVEITCSVFYG